MVGCLWLAGFLFPVPSFADGWHNATLGSKSIDNWLADVRAVIPGFSVNAADSGGTKPTVPSGAKPTVPGGTKPALPSLPGRRDSVGAMKHTLADDEAEHRNQLSHESESHQLSYEHGGVLPVQLTAAQKIVLDRKALECLEVLAYMDQKNIFPNEFPNFPMDRIPEYRQAAKELLRLMGQAGATAAVNQVRFELMGAAARSGQGTTALSELMNAMIRAGSEGLPLHAGYYDELLELLRRAVGQGWLSGADLSSLEEAASGQKTGPQAELAKEVLQLLVVAMDAPALAKLATGALLNWAKMRDLNATVKSRIETELGRRPPSMTIEELLEAVTIHDLGKAVAARIEPELSKRLPNAKLVELYGLMTAEVPLPLKQVAARHAAERTLTSAEFRDQLSAVATFLRAANPEVAQLAQTQVVKGVRRATMSSCLQWLGAENDELDQIIRKQIDRRLQSADEPGRGNYAKSGISVLGDKSASLPSRRAAIELLRRLKPEEAVGQVTDLLPTLPPELRPVTTELLKDLGKDLSGSQTQSLIALVEQMQQPGDRVAKNRQEEKLRQLAGALTIDQLLDAARIGGLSSVAKARLRTELSKRLATATLTELLGALNSKVSLAEQQAAVREAAERPLPIAQLRAQMPALVRFLKATDPQVAELARTHIVAGVRSASMPDCLAWLGLGNHQLNELIGEQVDSRLQSVDEQQRAKYVESGISVLGDQNASLPSRQFAMGLLRRLKPQEVIGPLIDLLPKLPPELRPLTGELLEELTGQDYGPKHGGENAEVEAAVAKWRAWWAAHRDPPPPAAAKPDSQGS